MILDAFSLQGKVAVVSGCDTGLGQGMALGLAEAGCDIVGINIVEPTETIERVTALGRRFLSLTADLRKIDAIPELLDRAVAEFGHIDILVNNAGITKDGLLMGMSEEAFDRVIETNLKGTFNCIRFAARPMIRQKSGCIINMASVVGVAGNAGQANYAASKAGVIGLTKTAARELASRGIRVNAIAPGFIETDMTEVLSDKVKEASVSQIPLGHFGKPEDVANLAAFLASEAAAYITGQVIHCDGGMVI